VPDAVADGFGGVVFAVIQFARLVTAKGLVGERPRVGDRYGPGLCVVGMQGGVEPKEAPPSDEKAVLGKALQFGRRKHKDRPEAAGGVGFVLWEQVGELRFGVHGVWSGRVLTQE